MSKRDIHADITAQIIAALEAGTPPWRRPWGNGLGPSLPRNAVSGNRYRGVNALLLAWHPLALASGDPRWCTYHQAQDKGWQVRKGEKGTAIIFFKKIEIDDACDDEDEDDADPRFIPLIRTFVVFHASQMDGIPSWTKPAAPEQSWQAPETIKVLLTASGVGLHIGGAEASYSIARDLIRLPPERLFRSPESWAATALHELAHATGHPSRLDRDMPRKYGGPDHAMEELRAELASAFVCAELGLPTELEQHASYIGGWLEALKHDKREIFHAAAVAQGIADWVLALTSQSESRKEQIMINDKAETIRRLNDTFRRSFQGGKVFLTEGVRALGDDQVRAILRQVRTFDAFTPDNDPYQEHDFGAFAEDGTRVFWKIEYFDAEMESGSPDPADREETTRVMTVMLAEEW